MADQEGGLGQNTGPISRLVSIQFTPTEQIKLIKEMLADRGEQEMARVLQPGDASKLIELLDSVLRADRLDASIRPSCVRYLARVCGWHILLPKSAEIAGHEPESELDGGGYSTVWIGSHNSRKVAIKVLAIYEGDDNARKKEVTRVFFKEVITWKNLSHPNLLPFVGAKVEPMQGAWKYEIISEFMENGPINTFIRQNQGVNRLELLKDITMGLKYLHSQQVVHGDLKGQNILINNHRRACLADFGLARVVPGFASSSFDTDKTRGTPVWMSPEVCWPDRFGFGSDARPRKESDVYALGTVIYEVICGHRPFPELGEHWAAEKLLSGIFPTRPEVGFTDSLWQTVERCCRIQPKERPRIDAVFKVLDEASRASQTLTE